MIDEDLRTCPTLVLHVNGSSISGAAKTPEPGRQPSPVLAADERSELRPGEEDLLLALARLARAVLPATSGTCLTLHESARTSRTLSDSALAEAVDRAQRRAGAGPSLAAHQDREPCCSADLREDPHWRGLQTLLPATGSPQLKYAPGRPRPISAVALPLFEGTRVLGVLTVYGDGHPLLIHEDDVAQLLTLGVVASQLLALTLRVRTAEESTTDLQVAVAGRAPVE